jgi:hypothetical protein
MSTPPATLGLERRAQQNATAILADSEHNVTTMFSPMVDENYWAYRVRLTDTQAVVGFPKFFTIGIGFAREEDWNTNLPYTSDAEDIAAHIWHNHGDSIPDTPEWKQTVTAAIAIIQNAIYEDGGPDGR